MSAHLKTLSDIDPYIRYVNRTLFEPLPMLVQTRDHRLFYLLEGSCALYIENTWQTVHADTLLIWPAGTPYRFKTSAPVRMIVIDFDYLRGSACTESIHPYPVSRYPGPFETVCEDASSPMILEHAAALRPMLISLCEEYENRLPYWQECASGLLRCILLSAHRRHDREYEWLERLLGYVNAHYADALSIEELARMVGYHPYHVNRVLKARTGLTLYQYIQRRRMEEARYLLETTTLPVFVIAGRCGFPSAESLRLCCRSLTGMSPSALRMTCIQTKTMRRNPS